MSLSRILGFKRRTSCIKSAILARKGRFLEVEENRKIVKLSSSLIESHRVSLSFFDFLEGRWLDQSTKNPRGWIRGSSGVSNDQRWILKPRFECGEGLLYYLQGYWLH